MDYSELVRFHGHECPGLAMGYRMSLAAMEALKTIRSEDEELVAIVENDACGVDAVQFLTGCTFGKGNLIWRDYGKQVYTFFSRKSGQGVRVLFHGRGLPAHIREDRLLYADHILKAAADDLVTTRFVTVEEPDRARVRASVSCSVCGEMVMETRLRQATGGVACIPCAEDRG